MNSSRYGNYNHVLEAILKNLKRITIKEHQIQQSMKSNKLM